MALADAWEVVVTREAEWDDAQRDQMLALLVYEGEVHRCGYHESLTHDLANHFAPTEETCPVCRGLAQFERIQHEADQKAEKKLEGKPREPRPSDGRRTYMRLLSPAEAEAAKQQRRTPRGHTP